MIVRRMTAERVNRSHKRKKKEDSFEIIGETFLPNLFDEEDFEKGVVYLDLVTVKQVTTFI